MSQNAKSTSTLRASPARLRTVERRRIACRLTIDNIFDSIKHPMLPPLSSDAQQGFYSPRDRSDALHQSLSHILRPHSRTGDLSSMTLSTGDITLCSEAVANAPQLESLDMRGCILENPDQNAHLLAAALRRNRNLVRVNTSDSNLRPVDRALMSQICNRNLLRSQASTRHPQAVSGQRLMTAPAQPESASVKPKPSVRSLESDDRFKIAKEELYARERIAKKLRETTAKIEEDAILRIINNKYLRKFEELLSKEHRLRDMYWTSVTSEAHKIMSSMEEEQREIFRKQEQAERHALWLVQTKRWGEVMITVSTRKAREIEAARCCEMEERRARSSIGVEALKTLHNMICEAEDELQSCKLRAARLAQVDEEERKKAQQRQIEEARDEFAKFEALRNKEINTRRANDNQCYAMCADEERIRGSMLHDREASVRALMARLYHIHKELLRIMKNAHAVVRNYEDILREPPVLSVHIPEESSVSVFFAGFPSFVKIERMTQAFFEMEPMWAVRAEAQHMECLRQHTNAMELGVSQVKQMSRILQDIIKKYQEYDNSVIPTFATQWQAYLARFHESSELSTFVLHDIRKVKEAKTKIQGGTVTLESISDDEWVSYDEIDVQTEWRVTHDTPRLCTVFIPENAHVSDVLSHALQQIHYRNTLPTFPDGGEAPPFKMRKIRMTVTLSVEVSSMYAMAPNGMDLVAKDPQR